MKSIQNIIIIGLAIIIIFLFTCNGGSTNTQETIKHYRDTVTTTIIDTVIISRGYKKLPVYIHDTIILDTFKTIPSHLDTFVSFVKDSSLEATITVYSETRPFIDFEYTLKEYEITNTVLIKDSVVNTISRSFLSAGGMMVGSKNSFGVVPCLQYNHKKGLTYMIGYDLIGNNIHVGFTKKISFSK